jgi:hypothetical protein
MSQLYRYTVCFSNPLIMRQCRAIIISPEVKDDDTIEEMAFDILEDNVEDKESWNIIAIHHVTQDISTTFRFDK